MAKVQNMQSSRGKTAPNQFVITTDKGEYFQSYQSVIAFKPDKGKIQLDKKYWDYSVTTSRYRNMFLNESKANTIRKIDLGEYLLTDLNK